jgi:hypothetical protein
MSLAHALHCAEECPDEVLERTILATFTDGGDSADDGHYEAYVRALWDAVDETSWPVDDGESA